MYENILLQFCLICDKIFNFDIPHSNVLFVNCDWYLAIGLLYVTVH
jgi:hypothetical protein